MIRFLNQAVAVIIFVSGVAALLGAQPWFAVGLCLIAVGANMWRAQ